MTTQRHVSPYPTHCITAGTPLAPIVSQHRGSIAELRAAAAVDGDVVVVALCDMAVGARVPADVIREVRKSHAATSAMLGLSRMPQRIALQHVLDLIPDPGPCAR